MLARALRPVSVSTVLRVTRLITPALPLGPYWAAPGPRTTSMRSMSSNTTGCQSYDALFVDGSDAHHLVTLRFVHNRHHEYQYRPEYQSHRAGAHPHHSPTLTHP